MYYLIYVLLICLFGVAVGATNDSTDGLKSCNTIKGYAGCACQMSDSKEIVGLEFLVKNDTQHRKPRYDVSFFDSNLVLLASCFLLHLL